MISLHNQNDFRQQMHLFIVKHPFAFVNMEYNTDSRFEYHYTLILTNARSYRLQWMTYEFEWYAIVFLKIQGDFRQMLEATVSDMPMIWV